ncbi:hypothetical protein [Curtobacterium sp. VKM Ac-1376]|uniref:hypothetical protein n=1 Tax=Curtobacterium sp. VKM Ac-1376 TaxID=123312 RepID=UPI00188CDAB9|nr:hypothetical protein [Curtobacterium sp. VKM Ac-1376]MBF4615487.1 hypothetical protein [Curtobacterium sp. VKM Ac-1376]
MDDGSIEVTVVLNDALASVLVSSVGRNQFDDRIGVYETVESDEGASPDDPAFASGAMVYTTGAADALLVSAYERARGFRTVLLTTIRPPRDFVVLTSRPASAFGL